MLSNMLFGFRNRIFCQPSQIPKTIIINGNVTARRIHQRLETLRPFWSKSKNVVLRIAETNVPGRKNIVTAAIVIMEEESRCVCSATLAVDEAIDIFV